MSRLLIVIALALVVLPALSLAGVRAEVSAVVGDDGIAQVRRKVLSSALTEVLKTVVNRHTTSDERQGRSRELSPIYKKTSKYISRYTIEAEGQRLERYRLSVVAEVDIKRLLSKLDELGFETRVLGAKPRVTVGSAAADDDATALAALVAERFHGVGIPAAQMELFPSRSALAAHAKGEGVELVFDVPMAEVEAHSAAVLGGNFHVACRVALLWEKGAGEEAGYLDKLAGKPALLEKLIPFMPHLPPIFEVDGEGRLLIKGQPRQVEVELHGGGFIVDALQVSLLGKHVVSVKGRGRDIGAARIGALGKLADALFQSFLADLNHVRWRLGGEPQPLEIRVEGVGTPALVAPLADKLKALTEVDTLSLARIEPRAVVWSASGIDPGFGWDAIASRVAIKDATIQWSVEPPPAAVAGNEGAMPVPKVLLGRIVAPSDNDR